VNHAARLIDSAGRGHKSLSGNLTTKDSLAIFVW
jgi:hypothetical protein